MPTPITDLAATLDRNSPVPLWAQLEATFARSISEGVLPPGSRLDPEAVLCQQLFVSRPTLRQAFDRLSRRGLIIRRRGSGTYVSAPRSPGRTS